MSRGAVIVLRGATRPKNSSSRFVSFTAGSFSKGALSAKCKQTVNNAFCCLHPLDRKGVLCYYNMNIAS